MMPSPPTAITVSRPASAASRAISTAWRGARVGDVEGAEGALDGVAHAREERPGLAAAGARVHDEQGEHGTRRLGQPAPGISPGRGGLNVIGAPRT